MHPSVETVRKCLGDSLLKSPTTILWARHSHATPYKDWRKNNQFIQFDVLLSQCLTMDWWLPKRPPSLLSFHNNQRNPQKKNHIFHIPLNPGVTLWPQGLITTAPWKKKTMKIPDFKGKFWYRKSSSTVCILSFFSNFTPKTRWTYCWWSWGTCARVDRLPILVMVIPQFYWYI